MSKPPTTLDDLFGDYEAERLKQIEKEENDPAAIARREAHRRAEIEREIRQGLRDANGDWIERPEADEETEDEDGDEDDSEA
ncbi:hypothetical protein [Bradyrhizobium sp. RT10b]|uniref:hypothetical protein n=1 Tax=Bradyrhizobium sp. RT10b TaxID=3156331 RepID=UPI0033972B72